jgi:hypothetical protein
LFSKEKQQWDPFTRHLLGVGMSQGPESSPHGLEAFLLMSFTTLAVQTGAKLDLEQVAAALPSAETMRSFQRHTTVDCVLNVQENVRQSPVVHILMDANDHFCLQHRG